MRIISKHIRHEDDTAQIAGHVNAAIAGNVGEGSAHTRVSSHQRVVQASPSRETTGGESSASRQNEERPSE